MDGTGHSQLLRPSAGLCSLVAREPHLHAVLIVGTGEKESYISLHYRNEILGIPSLMLVTGQGDRLQAQKGPL